MGLASDTTCPLEKTKNGQGAKANMLRPQMRWDLEKGVATPDLIRGEPCKSCLAGCSRAWG
jgi:hypothetical protein